MIMQLALPYLYWLLKLIFSYFGCLLNNDKRQNRILAHNNNIIMKSAEPSPLHAYNIIAWLTVFNIRSIKLHTLHLNRALN